MKTKIRYYLIGLLLNRRERITISATICDSYYMLNTYTDNMGESHKEFVYDLLKIKDNLKI